MGDLPKTAEAEGGERYHGAFATATHRTCAGRC